MSRRTALTALIAVASAACSKVAFLAANVPAAFGAYRRHADIAYGSDPQHRLDIYVPAPRGGQPPSAAAPATGPRPLIVFWHGGRWTFGDKSDYRFVGAALAQAGYVAVLPNYRHYPQVKMSGFMDDTARSALWAAAHAADYGANPGRLYLMGHSSGAHMAALVTLDDRYFAAAGARPPIAGLIGLSGPYDFLPLEEDDLKDMFGPPERFPESQPIDYVRAGAPPMLLVHGLRDTTVWPKNSRNFASAATARGVPVTLALYPKLDHADTVAALSLPARHRAPTLADLVAFIDAPRPAT